MKVGVVTFPGSNCDYDAYYVFKEILKVETVSLFHKEHSLNNCDVIVLPGGFSYGDYLRTGSIARFSPIMTEVIKFAREGGFVIGICNGFQILCECGLLPGVLIQNNNMKFRCFDVYLKTVNNKIPFTHLMETGQIIRVPIAHGDGNYYAGEDILKELQDNNQIVFKYVDKEGRETEEANPNGSLLNIAGICNKKGNVLGMMPHPERCSESVLGNTDGFIIFKSIYEYILTGGGNV